MWYCNPEHFCLIGQKIEHSVDLSNWRQRMKQSAVDADLRDSNLSNPYVLLSRYMFGGERLRSYVAAAAINTDDRPLIEFSLEQKRDERPTVEAMVGLQEPTVPFVDGASTGERAEINRRLVATKHLMHGQIEFWYPRPGGEARSAARSQIEHRKALLMYPGNEDIRQNLLMGTDLRRRLEARVQQDPNDAAALRDLGRIANGFNPTGLVLDGHLYSAKDIDDIIVAVGLLPKGNVEHERPSEDASGFVVASMGRREALAERLESAAKWWDVVSQFETEPTPKQLADTFKKIEKPLPLIKCERGSGPGEI